MRPKYQRLLGLGASGIFAPEGENTMNRYAMSVAVLAVTGSVCAQAVQWTEAEGGNGHWYEARVFDEELTAEEYFSLALAVGGYPASITSEEEDDFIYELSLTTPDAWDGGSGPSLGARRNDSCAFEWISGEAFDYTSWGPADPSGCQEKYLKYCVCGQSENPTERWWIDTNNNGCGNGDGDPCNPSGIIEWSADCNGDGIVDYGQIIDGTFEDADGNGVPDCCDDDEPCFPCPGDIVGNDGVVGVDDLLFVIAAYGQINVPADLDGDGVVDVHDILLILEYWGDCP